jgi:hypothetical protein
VELPLSHSENNVSRHDPHNLEVKFKWTSRGQDKYRCEIYLFLPSSIHASQWSRNDLGSDFNSRLRLSLARASEEFPSSGDEIQNFSFVIGEFLRGSKADEDLRLAVQTLGAFLGETIKQRSKDHVRELHRILSSVPPHTQLLCELLIGVEHMVCKVAQLHEVVDGVDEKNVPYLDALREYVNYLFIQYIGKLSREALKNSLDSFNESLQGCASVVTGLKRTMNADEDDLHRIGQLKKFFQSTMFVEIQRTESMKKFAEPVAAVAAGAAGLWATCFQFFEHSQLSVIGLNSAAVMSLGVGAYVLRDIIKDRGKRILTKKISNFVPDQTKNLMAKNLEIGQVREWFTVKDSMRIPSEVRMARRRFHRLDAESHVREDVLFLSREFSVERPEEGRRSIFLQENLRINFERYLKHMDDVYKEVTIIDSEGKLSSRQAHKVYFFHLVIRRGPEIESSRIVVDKTGIQRIRFDH